MKFDSIVAWMVPLEFAHPNISFILCNTDLPRQLDLREQGGKNPTLTLYKQLSRILSFYFRGRNSGKGKTCGHMRKII